LEKVCVHQTNALSLTALSAGTCNELMSEHTRDPYVFATKLDPASTGAPYKLTR